MANRLAHETSLYLRQHASNPVDWYPWGDEALARARELDRPIFLSIGYSACHWCHVMEHESFEDPETAALLNEHFISIKVDREERPDLDQIYMSAVQLLTRQGGWPMSMFLTPDLKPFFGGTYFPPDDRYGRPSFRRVLLHVARLWHEQRDAIEQQAGQVTDGVHEMMRLEAGDSALGETSLRNATAALRRSFDPLHGGFGAAPKFPHAIELRLLLRVAERYQDDDARAMAEFTLQHMAQGGMYDHLGGGFHRYSTDERWLVPHFEKMLYDNALLTPAYLEALQSTGKPFFREVVEDTLAYLLREMASPNGPFYSTQDADSEGVEGKYFVWSSAEVEQILGKDDAELFSSVYDVTPEGNWEEQNILHRSRSDEQEAKMLRLSVTELRARLARGKAKLLEARQRRVRPARDEKILTSWNGLMIAAFAQAFGVLERPEYLSAAQRAAAFLLSRMRRPDGRLWRTWCAGAEPRFNAYLEDYAFLIDALVTLYEADFDAAWIEAAAWLADVMIDQFWDDAEAGFFYTAREHEKLITRAKDPHDGSIPSGNAMAVTALLRLAKLTGRRDFHERAEKTLRLFAGVLSRQPHAAAQMLIALDFYLGPVREIAVVGNAPDEVAEALQLLRQRFDPRRVLAFKPAVAPESVEKIVPLLAGKKSLGDVTIYICRDFACQAPLVGLAALRGWANQDGQKIQ